MWRLYQIKIRKSDVIFKLLYKLIIYFQRSVSQTKTKSIRIIPNSSMPMIII